MKNLDEAGLRKIERTYTKAIGSIDMDKAKEHFKKQREQAEKETRDWAAEKNPEATFRASLKAVGVPEEKIDALWAEAQKHKS
jgi:hypothetical protein